MSNRKYSRCWELRTFSSYFTIFFLPKLGSRGGSSPNIITGLNIKSNIFKTLSTSGKCFERCLVNSAKPADRWRHGACMVCCLHDNNGDGFITKDDLAKTYEVLCGSEEEQQQGQCKYVGWGLNTWSVSSHKMATCMSGGFQSELKTTLDHTAPFSQSHSVAWKLPPIRCLFDSFGYLRETSLPRALKYSIFKIRVVRNSHSKILNVIKQTF